VESIYKLNIHMLESGVFMEPSETIAKAPFALSVLSVIQRVDPSPHPLPEHLQLWISDARLRIHLDNCPVFHVDHKDGA
jgi:hypothetical protein